jgi:ubiquitin-like-conjugating enzyme ATG10
MDIAHFPSLTGEEFLETCHHLDRRYCQAELGALRMRWKLRLRTVLRPEFVLNDIPNTYVQVTRILEAPPDTNLEIDFASLSLSPDEQALVADQDLMELEASDKARIEEPASNKISGFVTYEIHLHPTYRMPCLWFRVWGLMTGDSQYDLDTVFSLLVPIEYREGLRRYGGVGGISLDVSPSSNKRYEKSIM